MRMLVPPHHPIERAGVWASQQPVLVKVIGHTEECRFMLEQVRKTWQDMADNELLRSRHNANQSYT